MAASLISLSSPTPTRLPHLTSSFKVCVSALKPNSPQLPSLKTHFRRKEERRLVVVCTASSASEDPGVRFRLNNLGPQPGSRKRQKRKGRGIAAGQGNSCGFGMRGQKSRSGPGIRRGFEGGQMPLYRRLPKLRGIAGGIASILSLLSVSVVGVLLFCFLKWNSIDL